MRNAPAWSPEAWVRLSDAPEVAGVWKAGRLAAAREFARRGCPRWAASAFEHPTASAWLAADRSLGAADRPARLRADGYLASMLAAAAWRGKRAFRGSAWVDPLGHVHLPAAGLWIELPGAEPDAPAAVRLGPEGIELAPAGRPAARVPAAALARGSGEGPGWKVREVPKIAPGLELNWCDPLILWPIFVHGVQRLDEGASRAFVASMRRALQDLRVADGAAHAELASHVRVLVPLENKKGMSSVSSTYRELPGVVCLSHSEDSPLQQEALIHEYCHTKLNRLTEEDPLLLPGQGNAVFFSPWREDPRPLRGLLLGAHAFLNVALHHLRLLETLPIEGERRGWIQQSVAKRAFEVESALRVVAGYARLTPLGSRILSELFRQWTVLEHGLDRLPAEFVREAADGLESRRAARALGRSRLHRMDQAALA